MKKFLYAVLAVILLMGFNLSAAQGDEEESLTAQEQKAQSLAEASGTSVESITDLRESGMGWGEIAHELGVHPSVLGLGHTKKEFNENKARGRDMKGFSDNDDASGSKGGKALGLSGKGNNENKGKGNNSDKGNGSGKGNSSNQGGGGKK